MPDSKYVLNEILKVKNEFPLAIFDLDSTLYNVSHRTQKIVESFILEPEVKTLYAKEIEFLRNVKFESRDWGMKEALLRHSFSSTEQFYKAIREYWNKHFFSSNFLHADIPYDGAVEYVNELYQAGIQIYYLTGRDDPNMREGTVQSLRKWGFPTENLDKILIMKPTKGSIEDEEYKDIRIRQLKTLSPHVWFFENEPLIIHKVLASSPEVKIVWVDTTHSRRAHPPTGLFVIRESWKK